MNRSYYAVIPASVRYNDKLTPNAKLLYGEITALCNEKGFCWANNKYFADLYNVDKITISRWIKQLQQEGFISSDLIFKEGTKEVDRRIIKIINTPIQNCKGGINKIVKDINNIYINNNTNEYSVKSKKATKKTKSFSDFPDDVQKSFVPICNLFSEDLRPKTEYQKRIWCNTIDEVKRLDNVSPRKLYLLVKEVLNDDFWVNNFLALPKLRRKNKEGTKYIDVFMYKFGKEIKQIEL
jgi:hypothetical protein